MVKLVLLFRKREDLTMEQFLRHWREVHVPLVVKIPNIRRYVTSEVSATPGGGSGQRDFDGMAELWFADEATARASLEGPETLATGIDGRNFIEKGSLRRFFCEEREIAL